MLTIEAYGKVIFQEKYKGKQTTTKALNYLDTIGLLAVEYCKCADGRRIIVAMSESDI